jgi:fructosamine-3-kinase
MTSIHAVSPLLVPEPIGYGSYATLDDVHFFLCEFRNMTDELPDLDVFPGMMAELHRNATSPDGRFGFSVTTFHGNTPINHGWSDTWEDYFTRTTRELLQMEQETQGVNEEILSLSVPFLEKVVPRLLRPLETGGRSIKPALIHGDLWHGNAAMDADTGEPVIFDAASCYAHNECTYTNGLEMHVR